MSLARTALLWMTVVLLVVGLAAFAISYELAAREAAGFLDGQLRQLALNTSDVRAQGDAPGVEHDPQDEFVIEVWNANGVTVRQPANGLVLPRLTHPGLSTIHALGEDWRVYLTVDGQRHVEVGQRISVRKEMAQAAGWQAGVPILIVIPLAWLVILWSVGQMSRRLKSLAQTIAKRGIGSAVPIRVKQVPVEVWPLVEAMNTLTGRLEAALAAQKRFVSDAAHELRTPLAAVQLQIDNLAGTDGVAQAQLDALRAGVSRAKALTEQLLRLARMQEGAVPIQERLVDVTACLTQSVADFVAIAAAKEVDLGIIERQPVAAMGEYANFKMLFDNLIDNAVRYTPRGGTVDISIQRIGDGFVVEVMDTGCGVNDADIPRLCDRFFRAAPVDVEGSGLGLAIAAAVAKRHALTIAFANRTDRQGLRVRVETDRGSHRAGVTDAAARATVSKGATRGESEREI